MPLAAGEARLVPRLGQAALGSVAWQGLSFMVGKVLSLVTIVVLARILAPKDFGIVGLALLFITYAVNLSDLGVAQALVFLPPHRRQTDAALSLCLLTSLALMVVGMWVSPMVASFFNRPDITPMLRVLSLYLFLRGIGQVPDGLLRKRLQFRKRLVAESLWVSAQAVVSIILALLGLGPWAIIYGYVAGSIIWTAAVWKLVDYRPSAAFWRFEPAWWRPLIAYGAPAAAGLLVLCLVINVDYLIVGRILGAVALGIYMLGFRIPEMVILNVANVLSSVAFPVFSITRRERERFLKGYLFTLQLLAVYGMAVGAALAVLAPLIVSVVLGPQWQDTVVPLQALGLYAAIRSLGFSTNDVFRGIGRPGLLLLLSIGQLVLLVPCLVFATQFGINGVSIAQALLALPVAVGLQAVAARLIGLSLRTLGLALLPALFTGIGTALGAGAISLWMPGPDVIRLAVGALAAAGSAVVALLLTDRRLLKQALSLVVGRAPASTELRRVS